MIVIVVAEATPEEALSRVEALARDWAPGSFFVELRLDAMERPDPEIISRFPFQTIATCRAKEDGGSFTGSEEERMALLSRAATAGAAYVDHSMDVTSTPTLPWDVRRILSFHDFDGVPDDARLASIVEEGFASGADVVKLACHVNNFHDLLRLRRAAASEAGAVVVVGMGPAGLISRVLYESMGSPWTYVSAREGAPGLDPRSAVLGVRELMAYRGRTPAGAGGEVTREGGPPRKIFGILGDRAGDSIGPRVYNALFRKWGVSASYLPVSTDDLRGIRTFMKAFDIAGLSVTTPYKEEAAKLADSRQDGVELLGAANALLRTGETLEAANTDITGVGEPLGELLGARGEELRAWVIGAGGAGRAAALALRRLGMDVTLSGRTYARAVASAERVQVKCGEPESPPDVIVNATPAGSPRVPDENPVSPEHLHAGQVLFEMNYVRGQTPFVRAGRQAGARIVAGRKMFAAQGWHQLSLFLGEVPGPRSDLDDAVEEALS